jgi:hypothetical protein
MYDLGPSTCNTESRKTKREGREEAFGAVLAKGKGEKRTLII